MRVLIVVSHRPLRPRADVLGQLPQGRGSPGPLLEAIERIRLAGDFDGTVSRLPAALRKAGIVVEPKPPGAGVRIGGKRVTVSGQKLWRHFEGDGQRPWLDVVEFEDKGACRKVFGQRNQAHSGRWWPNHSAFITLEAPGGMDAVAAVVARDRYLFGFGIAVPCATRSEGRNTADEQRQVSAAADLLPPMLEAFARHLTINGNRLVLAHETGKTVRAAPIPFNIARGTTTQEVRIQVKSVQR